MGKPVVLGMLVMALGLILAGCPTPTDFSLDLDQTSGIDKLDSPSNFKATVITDEAEIGASQTATITVGGVLLTWDKVNDAVRYDVYRRAEENLDSWIYVGPAYDTFLYHMVSESTPYTAGNTYEYRVWAIPQNSVLDGSDTQDESALDELYNSDPAKTSVKINSTHEIASGLTLTAPTVADITLDEDMNPVISWNAVTFATHYKVYRTMNDGTKALAKADFTHLHTENQLPGRTTYTWVDSDELYGTYNYVVVAMVGSENNPVFSPSAFPAAADQKSVTIDMLATPDAPDTTAVSAGIKLTWDSVQGADTYKVFRSSDGGTTFTDVTVAASFQTVSREEIIYLDTDATDNDLVFGQEYFYKNVAIDLADDGTTEVARSDASDADSAVFGDLDTSGLEKAVVVDEDKIVVTFEQLDDADGFRIYRSADGGATYTQITRETWSIRTDVNTGGDDDAYRFWDKASADDGPEDGESYTYRIVYYKGAEADNVLETTASLELGTHVFGDNPFELDMPAVYTVNTTVQGVNVLYWEPVADANYYIIERTRESTSDYRELVSAADSEFTVAGNGAGFDGTTYLAYQDDSIDEITNLNNGNPQANYRIYAAVANGDGVVQRISEAEDFGGPFTNAGTLLWDDTDILAVERFSADSNATSITLTWEPVLASSSTYAADDYRVYVRKDVNEDDSFSGADENWLLVGTYVSEDSDYDAGAEAYSDESVTYTAADFATDFLKAGYGYNFAIIPVNKANGIELELGSAATSGGVALNTLAAAGLAVSYTGTDTTNPADGTAEQHELDFTITTVSGAKRDNLDNNGTFDDDDDQYILAVYDEARTGKDGAGDDITLEDEFANLQGGTTDEATAQLVFALQIELDGDTEEEDGSASIASSSIQLVNGSDGSGTEIVTYITGNVDLGTDDDLVAATAYRAYVFTRALTAGGDEVYSVSAVGSFTAE